MPDREGFERPQLYCRNCGAQARLSNTFCVSCGERLNVEVDTQPIVRGSGSRNRSLLDKGNTKVALYGAGALLLLVVFYLLFIYSVPLGFLLIGLTVLAVLVTRQKRGIKRGLSNRCLRERVNTKNLRRSPTSRASIESSPKKPTGSLRRPMK
jgi:hypothetical protein